MSGFATVRRQEEAETWISRLRIMPRRGRTFREWRLGTEKAKIIKQTFHKTASLIGGAMSQRGCSAMASGSGNGMMTSQDRTTAMTVVETDVPARLDRLPWARFHWLVLIGLGVAWILRWA